MKLKGNVPKIKLWPWTWTKQYCDKTIACFQFNEIDGFFFNLAGWIIFQKYPLKRSIFRRDTLGSSSNLILSRIQSNALTLSRFSLTSTNLFNIIMLKMFLKESEFTELKFEVRFMKTIPKCYYVTKWVRWVRWIDRESERSEENKKWRHVLKAADCIQ